MPTSFAALHMKLELRDSAVLVADREPEIKQYFSKPNINYAHPYQRISWDFRPCLHIEFLRTYGGHVKFCKSYHTFVFLKSFFYTSYHFLSLHRNNSSSSKERLWAKRDTNWICWERCTTSTKNTTTAVVEARQGTTQWVAASLFYKLNGIAFRGACYRRLLCFVKSI